MLKMLENTDGFLDVISVKPSFVGNYTDENKFCSVWLNKNDEVKELVLVCAYHLADKSKQKKANRIAKETSADKNFVGNLTVIQSETGNNIVYLVYRKQIADCFGIRNKQENYTELLISCLNRLFSFQDKLVRSIK